MLFVSKNGLKNRFPIFFARKLFPKIILNRFKSDLNQISLPNIPKSVLSHVGRNLHKDRTNPVGILKRHIEKFFLREFVTGEKIPLFKLFDSLDPKVTTEQCFDQLATPKSHPSRSPKDTFYFDSKNLLRTHMTAHDVELLKKGHKAFITSGDCYRNDTIDSMHFPVFHQMDGVRVWSKNEVSEDYVLDDLKKTIGMLMRSIFGDDVQYRWNSDYFPFTEPSVELEIQHKGEWIEILGGGVLRTKVIEIADLKDSYVWAFGIGLERMAMALFAIPDIRLFHSKDERFKKQFQSGEIKPFQPFSKFPACFKDVSFWIDDSFNEKSFFEAVKGAAGDLVESIDLIDKFNDAKSGRSSRCYRIFYRSFERNLENFEVDILQEKVIKCLGEIKSISLR